MFLFILLLNRVCFGADYTQPIVEKTVIHATTILKRRFHDFAMEIAVQELDMSGKHHYFYACDATSRNKMAITLHGNDAEKEFVKLIKQINITQS